MLVSLAIDATKEKATYSADISQAVLDMLSLIHVQKCTIALAMRMRGMAAILWGKTKVVLHCRAQNSQAMDAVKHAHAPALAIRLVMSDQEEATKRSVHRLVPCSVNGTVKRLDIRALEEFEEKV
ncbi:hypothetical protein MKX08_009409 [Trichoderma sp. CBMAI-0020]|nr:hypothetical protein MKX08_009409 [Trichoderma sp. CBMAI-0020]